MVELLHFLARPESALLPFASLWIDKRNLLEAQVIVTTCNRHVRLDYSSVGANARVGTYSEDERQPVVTQNLLNGHAMMMEWQPR